MRNERRPPFRLTREHARKGGQVTAAQRRAARAPFAGPELEVADAGGMSGPTWFGGRTILKATFGRPLDANELAFYRTHTGRDAPPPGPVGEVLITAGRRGGKSRIDAVAGFYLGIRFDPARLAPGELAVVPIIAADRKQARAVFGYLRALCEVPKFKPYVSRVLKESIELANGVNIEVHTASYRTIRGPTIVGAVIDELAFLRDDSSANPDSEILDALRPGMATVPDAVLFLSSSPYARTGEMFRIYDRYYGVDDPHVVVWNCSTVALNPSIPEHVIKRAFEEDPVAAASEYGENGRVVFRRDVEAFLDPDAVRTVTMQDRRELPPMPGVRYAAFVDPSGGSQDSFTLAVAHSERGVAVLDAVRERRPPFSPDAVVEEYAALLERYGISSVTGDRYAGEWPRERFKAHGIRYVPSEYTKSDLYREVVAPINAARIELLDIPALRAQLGGLERRVARGGKDSIDHAPGARDDIANAAVGALTLVMDGIGTKKRQARFG